MPTEVTVRKLGSEDIRLIALIDRSEHVDVEYTVAGGRLVTRPVTMTEIPPWDPAGSGPHSVAARVAFCAPIAAGGAAVPASDGERLLGLAVVDGAFEPGLARLAFLHVGGPHRRRGAASALGDAAVEVATASGTEAMYVSATPTGSAVGFYLSRDCALADPVHPDLYAREPDDIHLVCRLGQSRPEASRGERS
ncbi:MAG: GNAT family N-acetyltransferase [Chloroflexi bacterium]|nr:GNAT family N-acetyltransferase [Chloroflexota bacterium]